MKLKHLALPLAASCLMLTSLTSLADTYKAQQAFSEVIVPGVGYSQDTQQISKDICFNTQTVDQTSQEGMMHLDAAMSFDDLQNELHINVGLKGGVDMFSGGASSSYFHSIQNTSYSLALNYYHSMFNTVRLQIQGSGQNALNANGKDIYNNLHNYFGIRCGDDYISSFKQGALLVMALNLRFTNHIEKERFEAQAGGGFGDLMQATTSIQQIASQLRIRGNVTIQAFQQGGDPAQLGRILSRDPSGNYYALTCSLQDIASCQKAASGLLTYARENLPQQVSFTPPTRGLVPFGLGFAEYEPVRYVGLNPAPTLVTPEVTQNRLFLANSWLENKYYQDKLSQLVNGYPVTIDRLSSFYPIIQQSGTLLNQVNTNLNAIKNPNNPEAGALGCFNFPDSCNDIAQTIRAQLRPITSAQLAYLSGLGKTVTFAVPASSANPLHGTTWFPVGDNNFVSLASSTRNGSSTRANMGVASTAIAIATIDSGDGVTWAGEIRAISADRYSGTIKATNTLPITLNITALTQTNPLIFGAYQPSTKEKSVRDVETVLPLLRGS